MVAHLDSVTSLAVDPNGLYLLSGSECLSVLVHSNDTYCNIPSYGFYIIVGVIDSRKFYICVLKTSKVLYFPVGGV